MQTIEYKDGLKHGKFIVFGKRGKVLKEIKYSEGMRIIEGQTGGNGSFSPGQIYFIIENKDIEGPVNFKAPEIPTNGEFMKGF